MIRITTNGTLHTYQSNLLKSSNQLYSAMNKLMTKRNFDSYAADPAGATRAFKIHSSLNATNAQAANNTTVVKKFQTAWANEDKIIEMLDELGKEPALSGLNGTNFTVLDSYAQVIRSAAESVVQSLNSKYDDDFLFNGAETGEPPFAIVDDATQNPAVKVLTFRGWRVDVPENDEVYLDPDGNQVAENGEPISATNPGPPLTNRQVHEKLEAMAGENLYIDIGQGFQLQDDGTVDPSTAYDSALSGLKFLGYGVDDETGDPKNAVSMLLRLADIYDNYDTEANKWGSEGDYEHAKELVKQFGEAQGHLTSEHTALSAEVTYLNTNAARLQSTFDSLNEERANIEDIDEVDAILQLSWAQTSYNAALQVGANVIPQSLMDYLQ